MCRLIWNLNVANFLRRNFGHFVDRTVQCVTFRRGTQSVAVEAKDLRLLLSMGRVHHLTSLPRDVFGVAATRFGLVNVLDPLSVNRGCQAPRGPRACVAVLGPRVSPNGKCVGIVFDHLGGLIDLTLLDRWKGPLGVIDTTIRGRRAAMSDGQNVFLLDTASLVQRGLRL
ncbi:MAG: hypothetical protein KGL39_53825 [Patescibacteria group bacterium]|nr:hypothetical protein [Patescibacteria group bacterium]